MENQTEQLHKLLHDIKSPITSILGFSEMLKKTLEKQSLEKESKWSENIYVESKKIKDLIEQISEEVKKLD